MFDQYQYNPNAMVLQGNAESGMGNPLDANYANAFSGGADGTMVVDARKQPDGTMIVRRVRPGGDPHWTQSATFRMDPATGQPTQVSDWGGDQKDGPAGRTVGQGLALAALAAGGLGAAGFLGGAGAGAGAAAGAAGAASPFEAGFVGSNALGGLGAAEGATAGGSGFFGASPFADAGAFESGFSGSGALSGLSGIGGEAGLGGTASAAGVPWESDFVGSSASPGLASSGGGGGMFDSLGESLSSIGKFASDNKNLLNLGGNLLNGYLGSRAADKAAEAQMQAAAQSNALLKSIYDQNRADNAPMLATRNLALGGLNGLISDPSSIVNDPGYKFGLDQGTQAIDRSAASKGGLYSGATLKALQRFGTDYSGTKLDQSYNRLSNAAGLGQVGANNNQTASMNYGNQAQQNITGAGNAQGSAYIGSSNAWGGAMNNALNGFNQQSMLDQLLKKYPNGLGG